MTDLTHKSVAITGGTGSFDSTMVCHLLASGVKNPDIRVLGPRHGEKMHETLLSSEERGKASDPGDYDRPETRQIVENRA